MHPTNCLNCSTMLTADDRFCPCCGQKSDTHKMTMGHIWHDLWHAFTHTDKGIIHLMRELLFRPGHVAREYVDGKRKKYYNPFSFLVIVVAIATFLSATFNLMAPGKTDPISVFLNKHTNLIIFFNVPISAFFTWLFFRKRTYAENLVACAYAAGERSAFYSLIVVPVMLSIPQHYMKVVYVYMFIWILYSAIAAMQFFQKQNAWGFIRGLIAAYLSQVVIWVLIYSAYMYYYRVYLKV